MISRLLLVKGRNIHCDSRHRYTLPVLRTGNQLAVYMCCWPPVAADSRGSGLAKVHCLTGSILSMNGFVSHAFTRRYVERCKVPAGLGKHTRYQRARFMTHTQGESERDRDRERAPEQRRSIAESSVASQSHTSKV